MSTPNKKKVSSLWLFSFVPKKKTKENRSQKTYSRPAPEFTELPRLPGNQPFLRGASKLSEFLRKRRLMEIETTKILILAIRLKSEP